MEIEVRNEKVWFIKNGKQTSFCAECGGQMLTIDAAAQAADFGSRAIFHLVEAGQIHFRETPQGLILVCFASLSENGKNREGEIKK